MWLHKSKLIPSAFWVGFVALGIVTSIKGPDKPRVIDRAATWSPITAVAPGTRIAQSEPSNAIVDAKPIRATP
jgi:hypothetical protein